MNKPLLSLIVFITITLNAMSQAKPQTTITAVIIMAKKTV